MVNSKLVSVRINNVVISKIDEYIQNHPDYNYSKVINIALASYLGVPLSFLKFKEKKSYDSKISESVIDEFFEKTKEL